MVLEELATTIRHLEAILAQMVKLESYNEAVQLLRDIIKLEKELREKTERERKKSLWNDGLAERSGRPVAACFPAPPFRKNPLAAAYSHCSPTE